MTNVAAAAAERLRDTADTEHEPPYDDDDVDGYDGQMPLTQAFDRRPRRRRVYNDDLVSLNVANGYFAN